MRRLTVVCPICGQKVTIEGKQTHAEARHWNASNSFLSSWNASEKYLSASNEERYYMYRQERNPYRFKVDDDGTVIIKYYKKKIDARRRDIMFILTLEDYCKLIYDAGIKVSDIGWGKNGGNDYVLARYHDIGPYAVGNCRFTTQQQNVSEAITNGRRHFRYTKNPPKRDRICKICGSPIDKRAAGKTQLCQKCYLESIKLAAIKSRPDKNTLISELKEMSMSKVARKYNVTMTTIANWCDDYKIPHYSAYINEYKSLVDDDHKIMQKFATRKSSVRKSGVEFTLSAKEFCKLLHDQNLKSSDIGFCDENYILWRIDNSKPYENGNCVFIKKSIIQPRKNTCGSNNDVQSNTKKEIKERPSREELKALIRNTPFLTIGKRYGVCDNAIRKWCKAYNLPYKSLVIRKMTDDEWADL